MSTKFATRLTILTISLAMLGTPALGTWSIVCLKRSTGEVCVASATCIESINLGRALGVVVVGKGAGAAQSAPDTTGENRGYIFDGLLADWTPDRIFDALATDSSLNTRQYGIVGMAGPPVTFTGGGAGAAKLGVTGTDGDIEYAIQGNVLAGEAVVLAAERAFLYTEGDLSQKVMAGMQAARMYGGDGRCSCDPSHPPSCGSPPPNFTHSAYTAFIALARIGNVDGVCAQSDGCMNGDYFLDKKFIGTASDPDPIEKLQERYDVWRGNRAGKTDHIHSLKLPGAQRLVADGVTSTEVLLRLVDIEGDPVPVGGQTVTILQTNAGPSVATAGPVTDHGDGTHTFTLTATTDAGPGSWRIVVQDHNKTIHLHPDLELAVDPVTELHVGFDAVSATAAPIVPFVLNAGAAEGGRPYLLLGSASGTSPGTPWTGGLTLPLNSDRLLEFTLSAPNSTELPGSQGALDATGRAEAALAFAAHHYSPFVGGHFDFCAVLAGAPDAFTNVVGFDVMP